MLTDVEAGLARAARNDRRRLGSPGRRLRQWGLALQCHGSHAPASAYHIPCSAYRVLEEIERERDVRTRMFPHACVAFV